MDKNGKLFRRAEELYNKLSTQVESQEELITLLEIAKMQAYRNINMFDISKGNHIGYKRHNDEETDSKEA